MPDDDLKEHSSYSGGFGHDDRCHDDKNKKDKHDHIRNMLEDIEDKLDNPQFGLREIKREIKAIEDKLDSPSWGLIEIKNEIKEIENKLDHPETGLGHIKKEIRDIEDKLDSPSFGLMEIKNELKEIENKLDNPNGGLPDIKMEIRDIEAKLDSPNFGLAEIKREIREIEEKLDRLVPPSGDGVLTTGPVVADNTASSLVVKVENVTNATITVVVTVFDIGTCPNPRTVFATTTLTIQAKCARSFIFDKPPLEYEVQFSGPAGSFTAWTATRTQGRAAPLTASVFIASNTFRHSELFASPDP